MELKRLLLFFIPIYINSIVIYGVPKMVNKGEKRKIKPIPVFDPNQEFADIFDE